MPYIKSISIHNTVNKSIAYILNPKKTEGMLLTTSINCTTDPEDAYLQMKMIYEHYTRRCYDEPISKTGKSSVKAIHYIMSFADSENVTPEYAFKVAKAFVRNTFGDDAQASLQFTRTQIILIVTSFLMPTLFRDAGIMTTKRLCAMSENTATVYAGHWG